MALTYSSGNCERNSFSIAKDLDLLDEQHAHLSREKEARLEELRRLLSGLDGPSPSFECDIEMGMGEFCVHETLSGETTPTPALSCSSTQAPSRQDSRASTPTSSACHLDSVRNGVRDLVLTGTHLRKKITVSSELMTHAVRGALFGAWHSKGNSIRGKDRYAVAEGVVDQWALHYSALDGDVNMVQRLVSLRASPSHCDQGGVTPLHLAAEGGHVAVVQVLLVANASPSVTTFGRKASTSGVTPLHAAACAGSSGVVKLLLGARAGIDQPRDDNITALHFASQGGHVAVAWMLLEGRADANAVGIGGFRPLHDAAHGGHEQVVIALLASRACPNPSTDDGTTPLHSAARCGHTTIVQKLIGSGASCNSTSAGGFSSLHDAAHAGHLEIVHQLLKARACLDIRSDDGASALHLASRAGHKQVATALARGHVNVMRALRQPRKNIA
mmetsp:Transcript_15988/g.25560  ORF Transcript_15988/g.25560 Transcript_15988/m.25560 type:complete len:445 (-) Transcript_15988:159-1493(-)